MNTSRTTRPLLVSLVTVGLLAISAVALAAPNHGNETRDTAPAAGIPLTEPAVGTYLGACPASGDCADGLYCYAFRQNGPHCTKSCANDSECGAPSKGCSTRHQCALPK